MEKEKMDIKDFIHIVHPTLPPRTIGNLIQFANKLEFEDQGIITEENKEKSIINTKHRKVKGSGLSKDKSFTENHWYNLLSKLIFTSIQNFQKKFHSKFSASQINEISILKYGAGDFYKTHTDYNINFPRLLSVIIFLNNDYKGGSLTFHCPKTNEIIKEVKPEVGKLVLWPSNFMYPHTAQKVTEGTRFVIVSWIS